MSSCQGILDNYRGVAGAAFERCPMPLPSKALIRLFKQMKDYIATENKQLLGNDGIAQISSTRAPSSIF